MGIPWQSLGYGTGAVVSAMIIIRPLRQRAVAVLRSVWNNWLLMQGRAGIDGVRPAVKPLAIRVRDIESDMVTKRDHAGVVHAIGDLQDGQRRLDEGQIEIIRKMTRNGEDSPEIGDTVARLEKIVTATAEKLGVEVDPNLKRSLKRRSEDR